MVTSVWPLVLTLRVRETNGETGVKGWPAGDLKLDYKPLECRRGGERRIWGQKDLTCRLCTWGHSQRPGLHRKRCHFPPGKDSCGSKLTLPRGSPSLLSTGPRGIPPPWATTRRRQCLAAQPGQRCARRQGLPGLVSAGPASASAAPCRLPEPGAPGSPRLGIPGSAGARLPLGDIKDPAGGRARRPLTLGFPIADQVLEERAAGDQAGRHELQHQGQQEGGGQREPQSAQRVQRGELDPRPGSHSPRVGLPRSQRPNRPPAPQRPLPRCVPVSARRDVGDAARGGAVRPGLAPGAGSRWPS